MCLTVFMDNIQKPFANIKLDKEKKDSSIQRCHCSVPLAQEYCLFLLLCVLKKCSLLAGGVLLLPNPLLHQVFLILTMQLLVTFLAVAVCTFNQEAKKFVQANPWMMYISFIVQFAVLIVLACFRNVSRQHPWNFVALVGTRRTSSQMVQRTSAASYVPGSCFCVWVVFFAVRLYPELFLHGGHGCQLLRHRRCSDGSGHHGGGLFCSHTLLDAGQQCSAGLLL